MLGVVVNSISVIVGGVIGLILNKGIPERLNKTIMDGIALVVIYMGISGALKGDNPLYVIICICIGGAIGELIDLDKRLNDLGEKIDKKLNKNKESKQNNNLAAGFVSASLLYCVGAMAVVGAIQSGLSGDHSTLFAKSILDGVSSVFFAASMGFGVLLSSVGVFLYEGIIALGAGLLSGILKESVVTYMTCVGSILIFALGLNMLKSSNIKVANLLPAMFIPIIFGIFNII